MAESPTHKLGQIIGDEIEAAIRQPLQEVADEYGLYLDYKHARPARGGKKKVSWEDSYGNAHDLDYVLEEGGCEKTLGRPRAFIETALRRCLDRRVRSVFVLALSGSSRAFDSIEEAMLFVSEYNESVSVSGFVR